MKYLRIRKEANKNSRDSKRVPAEKMELAVTDSQISNSE